MNQPDIAAAEPLLPEYEWPPYRSSIANLITQYISDGLPLVLNEGDGVIEELEDKIENYFCSRYALLLSSGTAALHTAFFAVGISAGDEVLCPNLTFRATVMPLIQLGAKAVLCDSDIRTGNISPASIETNISEKTRAIVVTHLFGHPVDLHRITEIASSHGLALIEDCSHAHGSTYFRKKVGTFGDIGCFSMQGKKILPAGEGGFLITDNRECYERALLFSQSSRRCSKEIISPRYKEFSYTGFGLNYKIHPLSAVIANWYFDRLEALIAMRLQRLSALSEILSNVPGLSPPHIDNNVTMGAHYGYNVLYDSQMFGGCPKTTFCDELRKNGLTLVDSSIKTLHNLPFFKEHWSDKRLSPSSIRPPIMSNKDDGNNFPNSVNFYNAMIGFPTFTLEELNDVVMYARVIANIARKIRKNWGL